MKFDEAVGKVTGAQKIIKFLKSADKTEIFTSPELAKRAGVSVGLSRHAAGCACDDGLLFRVAIGYKKYFALSKDTALKFAKITGGKVEN